MAKASHVSGYINQVDYIPRGAENDLAAAAGSFDLPPETAVQAALRELREVGLPPMSASPELMGTAAFTYHNKENLFFYVLQQEVPDWHRFNDATRMYSWTLEELLKTRRYQVACNSIRLLQSDMSSSQRERAARIASANLSAHGDLEVARSIVSPASWHIDKLTEQLRQIISETAVFKYSSGEELQVDGIAGFQYRAFFSHILPCYARLGVPGANEVLVDIQEDAARSSAVALLNQFYNDEQFMTSVPVEM